MDREEDGKHSNSYKEIISVWDSDFLPFYCCHNKKGEEEKSLKDCLDLTDQFIYNVNKDVKADHYTGFLTKGKCFRYRVNPNYKANRTYANLPKYLKEVREHLIANHNFTWNEEYEADDLVVSFKKQYKKYNCCIISPDKDILDSVDIAYNPRKGEYAYNTNLEIEENFWRSMICGDTIDGIKGIPGKGKVYFKTHILDHVEHLGISFQGAVLNAYTVHFGEYKGIEEFYRNYMSLRLVDNIQIKEIKLNKVHKTLCE